MFLGIACLGVGKKLFCLDNVLFAWSGVMYSFWVVVFLWEGSLRNGFYSRILSS